MVERKVYLVLGILQLAVVVGTTSVVGGYLWFSNERAGMSLFLAGALVGALHLLVTLLQVNRVLCGRASTVKPVAREKTRYLRLRIAIMGVVAATLQTMAVPAGIEKHASPALVTAAAINVAVILSGSLFGFSHLGLRVGPANCESDRLYDKR